MDIEQSKERCKELTKEAHAGWIGLSNIKAIGNVLEELEKKDKVINEMANFIAGLDTDEEICKNIQCTDGENKRYKNCSDCIIEYFTNKAENVGE